MKKNNRTRLNFNSFLIYSTFLVVMLSCKPSSDLVKAPLIPKPVEISSTGKYFGLDGETVIGISGESADLMLVANYLAGKLSPLSIKIEKSNANSNRMILSLTTNDTELGDEGYELQIYTDSVKILANHSSGLFHGVQTFLQLLPIHLDSDMTYDIPTGIIRDYPEYFYRGMMLDVARHFFGVDEVKSLIDQMAVYKLNVLHLHLTDDQGWRIEIKSWPQLTKIGSSTEVGGGEGGFYTQEQYLDIVKYAQDRFITIVPEIDMPGHTNAALASYPELNCNGKATEIYTGIKVGFSSLCIKKQVTYQFVEDVITELAALTPGPYLHIGGDESHSTKTEDYIEFMNRVQEMVSKRGKKVLAWDEIAHADMNPNTIVQFWARPKNAILGIEKGAKVLMSPSKNAYLDMQYDSASIYGLHWAAYIEVDDAYNWDPSTLFAEISRENIVGIEAPLWTETVSNLAEAQYLIFPRLPGYAEIGWTPSSLRKWEEYRVRLAHHGLRMKASNINFYPSGKVDWELLKGGDIK